MGALACCLNGCWAVALALTLSGSARAEARSQAQLTCLLGSGDLLGHGDLQAQDEPPWQELTSLRRGDESRARLALSLAEAGFLPQVTTRADLRLEMSLNEPSAGSTNALRDASSSLSVAWELGQVAELSLRAYPFDTNYRRLGYLHALDWGGTDAAHGESVFLQQTGPVPGLELGLQTPRAQLFWALKWARTDDALRGERRLWGVLGGGSVQLLPALRVDGGFGYFQRATFTPGEGTATFVEGASLRVVWHRGPREPALAAEPFRPPSLAEAPTRFDVEEKPGFALALESVTLVQRMRRFEEPSSARLAPAPAAALYGSARRGAWGVHGALSWRSLAFVLRNDARLARGETLPVSAVARSELSAWFGANASVPALHLVPSCELAVRLPAGLETASVLPGFGQTLLAAGPAGLTALPIGAGRLPVVSGRLGARLQASTSVALSVFGEYERNPNRVLFAASPSGVTLAFARSDSLSFFVAAQARF